ncbi:MAG: helix-turn-helix domain-containing protein [Geminicoccaceae bacterium]
MPLLLTIISAAEELGVSPATMRDLINDGEIGIVWVRGDARVPMRELVRYVRESTVIRGIRPASARVIPARRASRSTSMGSGASTGSSNDSPSEKWRPGNGSGTSSSRAPAPHPPIPLPRRES